MSIADRIALSSERFIGVVWPAVNQFFGNGDLVPVETQEAPACSILDRAAGIDYLFVPSKHGEPIPIASRVSETAFRTITLTATQYQRLTRAGDGVLGRLCPAFFVHAYVDTTTPITTLRHVFVAGAGAVRASLDQARWIAGWEFWSIDVNAMVGVRQFPDPAVAPFMRQTPTRTAG